MTKLNIGCGADILPGFTNVDIAQLPGVDVVHDVRSFPWPFETSSVDEVRLINVLEHLPDTVRTMEELFRICRHSGTVMIRVPYWNCWQAFSDPTHVRCFHQTTLNFFDPDTEEGRFRHYYSKARFYVRRVDYWMALLPTGRAWVKIRNRALKAVCGAAANYMNGVIWALEYELEAVKLQDERG